MQKLTYLLDKVIGPLHNWGLLYITTVLSTLKSGCVGTITEYRATFETYGSNGSFGLAVDERT